MADILFKDHEMDLRGIPFERQKHLPVTYKGQPVGHYVADLGVDGRIILEIILNFAESLQHERVVR